MAYAEIKESHIKVAGKRYFKGNARLVEMGSYGRKKEPLTQVNYLEVQDRLPAPKMDGRIRNLGVIDIQTSSTNKADFGANANISGVFGVGLDTAWSKAQSGEYKFLHFAINFGDLEDAFNASPKALGDFADVKGKERAVSEIFVALSATEATKVDTATSFDVSVKAGALTVTANGGKNGSKGTDIKIGSNTVYAYMLANPSWENKKSKIKSFTTDQHSVG